MQILLGAVVTFALYLSNAILNISFVFFDNLACLNADMPTCCHVYMLTCLHADMFRN
jgi:hypothetical protein